MDHNTNPTCGTQAEGRMVRFPTPHSWEDEVAWVEPEYSRGEVNKAADTLMKSSDKEELAIARQKLSNWRSAHGVPVNALAMTLRKRAKKVPGEAIIAQRLKRLVSIEHKLRRLPNMKATQMQDIGGARIVVPSMKEVAAVHNLYKAENSRVFEERRTDDYVSRPKSSGYRSVHIIYRYNSDKNPEWRNMRVELQIRSSTQHAWAAAVEAVSFFQGQDLKASDGDANWLRFFLLMGHWMAQEEDCPGIESLRNVSAREWLGELGDLWYMLNAELVLSAWGESLRFIQDLRGERDSPAWLFLLHLDAEEGTLRLETFRKQDESTAANRLARLEAEYEGDARQHVVLVTARDVQQLRSAYPAFFADTVAFLQSADRAVHAAANLSERVIQERPNI